MDLKSFNDLHLINNNLIDIAIIKLIKSQISEDDIIVFGGDIFNTFNVGLTNETFYKFISSLKNKIFLLTGNHDWSRGRCSFRNIKYFSKNVKVISGYYYEDINNYRLHFYNYFRYSTDQKFEIDENQFNVLFSHFDLDTEKVPLNFQSFDAIINGHIHSFSKNGYFINSGSIRQVAINESRNTRYISLNLDSNKIDYRINEIAAARSC